MSYIVAETTDMGKETKLIFHKDKIYARLEIRRLNENTLLVYFGFGDGRNRPIEIRKTEDEEGFKKFEKVMNLLTEFQMKED